MTSEHEGPTPSDRAEVDRQIATIRERMDALDARLVALLNERASCAREIGVLKDTVGLEVHQPDREIEVLRYLARGLTKKEIGNLMHLSTKTIESHSTRVMDKLDIHDRVELARYAIREGLAEA